jgi:hypothetical protein
MPEYQVNHNKPINSGSKKSRFLIALFLLPVMGGVRQKI